VLYVQGKQDCEAAKWMNAKKNYEAEIADLKQALTCLEKTKIEACRKLNAIIGAHHVEMNNLKSDADQLQQMYKNERNQRELLESKLRDCEQRNRNSGLRNSAFYNNEKCGPNVK